jgi:hypothetical protein
MRVPAPLLDPSQVDAASRDSVRALRQLAGVDQVISRAAPGELRLVVRMRSAELANSAAAVAASWQAHAPKDFAAPISAAIAKGARARVAWVVTGAQSDLQMATASVQSLARLATALPGASRLHVAGAVTPTFTLEVLTRTLADNRVSLATALQSALGALANPQAGPPLSDSAESAAWLHASLDKARAAREHSPGDQALEDVPLSRLFALRRGVSIAPQAALVGRNPALLVLADAGSAGDSALLSSQEAALRRDPQWRGAFGEGSQLLPQTVDAAQRFVLQLRPGQTPETPEQLAQRLLAVRDVPNLVGALAVRGWDGVPAQLDGADPLRLPWTVWVTASGGKIEESLSAARQILSAGPWQAVAIAANQDPALAWLLEQPAAAGVLLSASEPAAVSAAAASLGGALQRTQSIAGLSAGPIPQPPHRAFGQLDTALARQHQLRAQELADAQDLLTGELVGPELRGAWLAFALPRGDMTAEQGRLPLAYRGGPGQPLQAIDLALLQPLLDRLRVDDRPALFVLAQSASATALEPILAVRDAVERHPAPSGVQLLSWTLAQGLADAPSCVP